MVGVAQAVSLAAAHSSCAAAAAAVVCSCLVLLLPWLVRVISHSQPLGQSYMKPSEHMGEPHSGGNAAIAELTRVSLKKQLYIILLRELLSFSHRAQQSFQPLMLVSDPHV